MLWLHLSLSLPSSYSLSILEDSIDALAVCVLPYTSRGMGWGVGSGDLRGTGTVT